MDGVCLAWVVEGAALVQGRQDSRLKAVDLTLVLRTIWQHTWEKPQLCRKLEVVQVLA